MRGSRASHLCVHVFGGAGGVNCADGPEIYYCVQCTRQRTYNIVPIYVRIYVVRAPTRRAWTPRAFISGFCDGVCARTLSVYRLVVVVVPSSTQRRLYDNLCAFCRRAIMLARYYYLGTHTHAQKTPQKRESGDTAGRARTGVAR